MGTWVLLLPLLFAAEAQAQGTGVEGTGAGRAGGWAGRGGLAAPTLPPRRPVCSVEKTFLTVEENTNPGEPLLDIYVPEGQQVTLGPSSTPFAFRIQGNQLFLNVTPDYEVRTADPGWLCPWGQQGLPWDPPWALTLLPSSLRISGSQFAHGASWAPWLG